MPCFDFPLEKLQTYKGISPKPSDFDAYWEKALKEMNDTEPNIEMKPANFKLKGFEFFDLFFDGVRSSRIHAKVIKPVSKEKLPIALHFHGYSGRANDWIEYISMAAAGFCVFALDCRGQGGISEDMGGVSGTTKGGHLVRGLSSGKDDLLFRHVFLDTAELAKIAMGMDFADKTRLCAYGGSQGGALTLACAALVPEVKYIAPIYPFLCDYKRVWEMDLSTAAYSELTDYFRRFDPLHLKEDEIFMTLAYIDNINLADKIKAEVLLAAGLADNTCPPSTVFAAYNRINSPKTIRVYPDYNHENLPGFMDEVIQWFQNKLVK